MLYEYVLVPTWELVEEQMFQESGEQELLAQDSFHPGLAKRFSWIIIDFLRVYSVRERLHIFQM